ncbi:heterokaryon incompatibility protein-domain-containing protein [Thelonectria olida]|uniref:Heterokaryon incompatibility protein-domain-containing protein n=1 Tax=Thelonectria olida TaxID=1576542 RepID=A0A9P8W4U9_9HYPO|nr:heterokaryon incompatibility protein-domain-containing protein [Thelonectria olida]
MRLLNTSTLELKTFVGTITPRYAILSHTWGEEEIRFEHVRRGLAKEPNPSEGLRKVLKACEVARKVKLKWIWIDTCCIDKSSSSELSEAINSMFKWYEHSSICLAFLSDVALEPDGTFANFDTSRWFTRGWTLQELIAPCHVEFFDRDWNYLSSSSWIWQRLSSITGIGEMYVHHCDWALARPSTSMTSPDPSGPMACEGKSSCGSLLAKESVATRMQWVEKRETTRPEDMAYCLMGIFDVNMPLLYGEGPEKAFYRLQQEIITASDDQSILLWHESPGADFAGFTPTLAQHPSWFRNSGALVKNASEPHTRNLIANSIGLEMGVILVPCQVHVDIKHPGQPSQTRRISCFLAVLACHADGNVLKRQAIFVAKVDSPDPAARTFYREFPTLTVTLSPGHAPKINGQIRLQGRKLNEEVRGLGYRSLRRLFKLNVSDLIVDLRMAKPQTILYRPGEWDKPSRTQQPSYRDAPQISLALKGTARNPYRLIATGTTKPPLLDDQVLCKHGERDYCSSKFNMMGKFYFIWEVLFFWRDDQPSGFFVLLADVSIEHRNTGADHSSQSICWVEAWESFTGQDEVSSEYARKLEKPEKLWEVAEAYSYHRGMQVPTDTGCLAEDLGLDVQVRAQLNTLAFLGCKAQRLTVSIDWRPESFLDGSFMSL